MSEPYNYLPADVRRRLAYEDAVLDIPSQRVRIDWGKVAIFAAFILAFLAGQHVGWF